MASPMEGYAEVPERIVAFHLKYPEGSLQSEFSIENLPNKNGEVVPHIIVKGYAYRTPLDYKPGIGHASEPVPGFTQFTKGSELMNAETSAWGRALVAIGFLASTKIASADEIRNRTPDPTGPAGVERTAAEARAAKEQIAKPKTLSPAQAEKLGVALVDLGVTLDQSLLRLQSYGVEKFQELTSAQAKDMLLFFRDKAPVAA